MRSALLFLLTTVCTPALASTAGAYSHLPLLFKPGLSAGQFEAQGYGYRMELGLASSRIQLRNGARSADLLITFHGSRPARLNGEDRQHTVFSEFVGSDPTKWRPGLPMFARVRQDGLYPGIDLDYYGTQKNLEYDFLVAPHSDPRAIQMNFGNQARLHLNPAGDLVVSTSAGELTEKRPITYQVIRGARRDVASSFILHGNRVGFRVGKYDVGQPLVIDPQIPYSTLLGGPGEEQGLAVAVDNAGSAYVAGYTTGNQNGDRDVLLASFNPAGNAFNYIVQTGGVSYGIGGSGDDVATGIAVDAAGSAYVVGRTNSNDFPVSANAFQASRKGDYDAFLLKVDASGKNLLYSTFLGGGSTDEAWGVAVDSVGNAYVAGDTNSDSFPVTDNVFQQHRSGGYDGFLAKFAADGSRVFSTFIGGKGDDRALALTIDAAGNSYLTGSTHSDEFPFTPNALLRARSGGNDGFVMKLNPTGSAVIFSTYLGGSDDDSAGAIALDSANNVYVAGTTSSSGFPVTPGAYRTTYFGGTSDIFVTKLAADGQSLVYSTFLGSHGTDQGNGLAVDSTGSAIVVGDTDSDAYPVTSDAAQNRRSGVHDGVISKLNPAGNALLYSSFIGGGNEDSASAIAVDAADNVYLTGYTASTNFPVASGAAQSLPGGGATDAFVVKYALAPLAPAVTTNGVVNGASFTGGGAVAPGSIISIFGSNFTKIPVSASATPLPSSLGNVTVTINGIVAPLFYVSANQVNAQVPYEVLPGVASVVVTGAAGASMASSITISKASPGLFLSGAHVIATNQDGSLNSASNPARSGSIVTVYLNGLGTLDHPVSTGEVASSVLLSRAALNSFATINGQPAMLFYLGLTPGFVGLAQANVLIPPAVSGNLPLFINVGGIPSNTGLISVTP
jgi:uncharacterized protein (TIGR03437 family)